MQAALAGSRSGANPLVLAVVLVALLAGCTEKLPTETSPLPIPIPMIAVVPDSVQGVFDAHCIKCHGGTDPLAGQDLDSSRDSWLALVNVRSNEDTTYFRVAPFDTLDSWLVMKLKNDPRILGSQMPLGDPPLPPAKIAVITGWIAQGAPADSIELPAARWLARD
jgi:hypothetical protein